MSYPGNDSLADDIKKRIVETFDHTLKVAREGNSEEARLGCDFVLRLDPEFDPAKTLMSRLEGVDGPIDVSDFEPGDRAVAEAAEAGLDSDLVGELQGLLASRDFDALARRAQQESAAIASDPALQQLMGRAQEKMEAAHFAASSLSQARAAMTEGDADKASQLLEQARSMDGEHPELAAVSALVTASVASPVTEQVFELEDDDELPELEALGGADEMAAGGAASLGDEDLLELDDDLSALDDELPALDGADLPLLEDDAPPAVGDDALPSMDDTLPAIGDDALPSMDDTLPVFDSSLPDLGEDAALELGAAELSDLGEEEAPPAPAPKPTGPSDPDERIAALLDEGQAAYEQGEHQAAIDAWSRIFLIDIDHEEAANRIEMARKDKDEQERQVEEAFHEAVAMVEAGETEQAKAALEKVLLLDQGHNQAQETLERLQQGDVEGAVPVPSVDDLSLELDESSTLDDVLPAEALAPEPEVSGDEGDGAAVPVPKPTTVRKTKGSFWMVAAAVILVLAGGGWLVMTRWDSLFPNTEEPIVTAPPPTRQSPIDRASELYGEGKVELAINQLRRVPPASPYYDEAQRLVGEWEGALEPQEADPSPADVARRGELLERARQATSERRFLEARPLFDQAARIAPLEAADDTMRRGLEKDLQPISGPLNLLEAGEYDRALRDLWLLREQDPTYPDVNRALVTAYFNQGVGTLKKGRPQEAVDMFREAADLAGDDEEVERLLQLCEAYSQRSQDMLFRIYVKYLSTREL